MQHEQQSIPDSVVKPEGEEMSVKRYAAHTNIDDFKSDWHESKDVPMVRYEDYAALEARCAALAAENAGLKAALHPSDIPSELTDAFGDTAVIEHDATGDNQGHSVSWSWVGNQEEVIKSVLLAVDGSIKTQATDAFLAEVRASGVDAAIEELNQLSERSEKEAPIAAEHHRSAALHLQLLSTQIRKGVQS